MTGSPLVLITGAGGFIGRRITERFAAGGFAIRAVEHRRPAARLPGIEIVRTSLTDPSMHGRLLAGVQVVLHLAGRAHVLTETAADPEAQYRAINAGVTSSLAQSAVDSGVQRFVLLSTIGVHGDRSAPGDSITESHPVRPATRYARSKWEAEQALLATTAGRLETTIIRPTLVYGPGAPGNIGLLRRAIELRVPLPFGRVNNCRSLLSREALADLLLLAATHSSAPGEVFVAGDARCLSTPAIVAALGRGLARTPVMLPVPLGVLRAAAASTGRRGVFTSLCESLVVNSDSARTKLGWRPVTDPGAELERSVATGGRQ